MSDLPKGWTSTNLENLGANTAYPIGDGDHGQISPKSYTTSGVPYIRVADIGWGNFEPNGMVHIPEIVHQNNLKSELRPNDIVIAKTGATIGKCCLVPTDIEKANTTSSVGKVTVNEKIVFPKWVLFYFLSREFKDQMWAVSEKTAQPGFSIKNLKSFIIPLAPLNEQKRIVEKLEKLLGKVEAVQARLDKIPVILKRFRQAVLAAACSGKLTANWRKENNIQPNTEIQNNLVDNDSLPELPLSWKWSQISKIGTVKGGKRLPKGETLVNFDTGQPYIKAGNLKNGTVMSEGIQYVPDHIKHIIRNYKVKANDVFITIVGACIGDAGVVPNHFDGANLTENAAKIFNLLETDPNFLAFWLRSPDCQSFIQENILSAAQGKLALFRIEQLPMPICSLEEQKEIVRRVEDLFKFADQIEARYKKARSYTDKLTQSILAKAFRGELVPQSDADEPADILLERIRQAEEDNLKMNDKNSNRNRKIKRNDNQRNLFVNS